MKSSRAFRRGTSFIQDDFFFLGPGHRFDLRFSNKSLGMRQPLFLIEQLDGQASPSVSCPPTLTVLLDSCLHIFCYTRVERPIAAAEDIDGPLLPPPFLHPSYHSKVFGLHVYSLLSFRTNPVKMMGGVMASLPLLRRGVLLLAAVLFVATLFMVVTTPMA